MKESAKERLGKLGSRKVHMGGGSRGRQSLDDGVREWGRTDSPLDRIGFTAVIRTTVGTIADASFVHEGWHSKWCW